MADAAENAPIVDPIMTLAQGKRHLVVRDFDLAASVLAQACELLVEKHGDTADILAEPYLYYGRALLGLARNEASLFGSGVPGSEEPIPEDDEDDDEDDDDDIDEEDAANGGSSETKEGEDGSVEAEAETSKTNTEEVEEKNTDETPEKVEGKKEEKEEEKKEKDSKEETEQDKKNEDSKEIESVPGTSAAGPSEEKTVLINGESSPILQNGVENGKDEGEDVSKPEEEDEVNNLQIAWEVLELAKLILLKRKQPGRLLIDVHRMLAEVAMESGNPQGALADLQTCLDLFEKTKPRPTRAIAEIHYQLGLAHSLANDFDSSIDQFNKATSLLEARIKELKETKEPPEATSDDPFYTIEGEIKELKELLPEIQEKITDMKDFKQEACKLVIEGIKNRVSGGCSNGAGPSNESGSSSTSPKLQKPASDISHLVRKKRKADEPETEVASPCKKPTPEKTV